MSQTRTLCDDKLSLSLTLWDNQHSLTSIPAVVKGTLASVTDGKGALLSILQTERGFNPLQCNAIPGDVWRSERLLQPPIHSCFNPTTALIDAGSIFPIGQLVEFFSVKMSGILFFLGGKYDNLG